MEPNQTNPSPENSGIPQGIPTGVFVPNNQQPAAVQTPTVQSSVEPVPVVATQPAPATEGPLDRMLKWIVRFFAKIMGQPDPITGAPNLASQTLQKSQNIVGKVRGAANQAVEKVGDVAGKAVNVATDVTNKATQKIQEVIPPPTATPVTTPVVEPTPVVQSNPEVK